MPLTVTIDDPAYEKGQEIYITGLPLMKNGEPYELTNEEELRFVSETHMMVRDSMTGSENVSVSGTTTITGGVEGALGVDPADISSAPSPDPTAENKKVAEKLGFPVELISVGGISTDPYTGGTPEEEAPADTTLPQVTGVLTPAHDAAVDAAVSDES